MPEKTNSRYLPDDIIDNNILIGLPVKDLLRYKCVCKRWYSLISSQHFASLHLDHSTSRKAEKEAILVRHSYPDLPVSQDPSNSVLYWHCNETLVGSINGLVAVVSRKEEGSVSAGDNDEVFDIWIWNPATRKSKKLPPSRLNGFNNCLVSSFGFGWDPNGNVYKLVKFVNGVRGCLGEVWSSDSDSWKEIDMRYEFLPPSPSRLLDKPIATSNVTVKGGLVVYWIFENKMEDERVVNNEDSELAVASFDVSSNVLKMIPFPILPVYYDQLMNDVCSLNGVFGVNWNDEFALVEKYTSGIPGKYTVWVLDVEHECWNVVGSFEFNDCSLGCLDSSNEKRVAMASQRLALCDMVFGEVNFVGCSEIGRDYVCEALLFLESLLGLDGFVACKEEWKI